MSWFSNLFKKKVNEVAEANKKWSQGFSLFLKGEDYFMDGKSEEALPYFDNAIELGYHDSDVFGERAICLQKLEFHYDAIDDCNKAIEKDQSESNVYYVRAISKGAIGDIEGKVQDINEAIRLSIFDNEYNRLWNDYAMKQGWNSATLKYEMDLAFAQSQLDKYRNATPTGKTTLDEFKLDKIKKIKRRGE